jgi:hypothetical protein
MFFLFVKVFERILIFVDFYFSFFDFLLRLNLPGLPNSDLLHGVLDFQGFLKQLDQPNQLLERATFVQVLLLFFELKKKFPFSIFWGGFDGTTYID